MINPGAAVYGLELRARSLAAVAGEAERHQFLVGTLSLKGGSNQIHLLEYAEQTNLVDCKAVWSHGSEIWDLACCPSAVNKHLFFTVWQRERGPKGATLWAMDPASDELRQLLALDIPAARVLWDPSGLSDHVLVVDAQPTPGLTVVSLASNCTAATVSGEVRVPHAGAVPPGRPFSCQGGAWDPNHPNTAALAADCDLVLCDLRAKAAAGRAVGAHSEAVRDVQYNANHMYHLASGGDDGAVRLWDTRQLAGPLVALPAHDHWVTGVAFNPLHDPLLISGGTDGTVKLWHVGPPSPSAADGDSAGPAPRSPMVRSPEALLRTYPEYEDSVYGVAWSACSPWVFAGVAYRGAVLLHQVPKDVKHRILLSQTY